MIKLQIRIKLQGYPALDSSGASKNRVNLSDKIINEFWFIESNPKGLFANFQHPPKNATQGTPNMLLFTFLTKAFERDYFINGLFKQPDLLHALFGKKIPVNVEIRLGSSLLPIDPSQIKNYPIPILDEKYRFAKYSFPRLAPAYGTGLAEFKEDVFLAQIWKHKVRFGFDTEVITQGVRHAKQEILLEDPQLVIAKQKDPLEPIDAQLDTVTSKTQVDTRAEEVKEGEKVDMYRFKNTIFKVKADEVIYKKTPFKEGKPGRDVTGTTIQPRKPKDDIVLGDLSGTGTVVKMVDDLQCVVVARDGTLKIDKKGRVSVDEGIVVDSVDKTTGNLSVDMAEDNMVIEGDIEDYRAINANVKKLTVKGRVYGSSLEVDGKTEVVVEGGMVNGKVTHKGDGTIRIFGNSASSNIVTQRGKIQMEYAENSHIMGKQIQIKALRHGVVIGRQVQLKSIENTQKGKSYVLGEQVKVAAIMGGGEIGITGLWKYKDTSKQAPAEELSDKQKNFMKKQIQDKEKELAAFVKKNAKSIENYEKIDKVLANPKTPMTTKANLLTEKKKVFSRIIQPRKQMRQEIDDLIARVKKTEEKEDPKEAAASLKSFRIDISDRQFSGDLFIHNYRYSDEYKSPFAMGKEKLEKIAQTNVLPGGPEGKLFYRVMPDASGPISWSAEDTFKLFEDDS